MEENLIDNYSVLYNKAIQIKSKYDTIESILKSKKEQKEELLNKMDMSMHKQQVYESAISYTKELLDLMSRNQIKHLEDLLNSAVTTIFYNKDYKIELEISEYRNSNCLTIYLIETKEDGTEIKTDIKDNGFGIKTVVGFILQIYFILFNKLSPVLVADEAFSAISEEYIPYLRSLLNSLTEKYGFIFILVSHDPRFIDIADKIYRVTNGEVKYIES